MQRVAAAARPRWSRRLPQPTHLAAQTTARRPAQLCAQPVQQHAALASLSCRPVPARPASVGGLTVTPGGEPGAAVAAGRLGGGWVGAPRTAAHAALGSLDSTERRGGHLGAARTCIVSGGRREPPCGLRTRRPAASRASCGQYCALQITASL